MAEIGHIQKANPGFLQKIKLQAKYEKQAEPSVLTRGGGVDTVSFTTPSTPTQPSNAPANGESWQDILDEFSQKYGNGRSLEQAKLGLEYMTRLLACEDLPDEKRAEFENEKVCYEMEVVEFENWEKARGNQTEKFDDVMKEMEAFIAKYKKEMNNATDRNQLNYQHEYVQVIHSFYQRMYNCSDLTPEMRTQLDAWVEDNLVDFNHIGERMRNLNKPQGESYADILEEWQKACPNGWGTIEELKTTIGFVDRLLNCDDLPEERRLEFQSFRKVCEQNIIREENYEKSGSGESVKDVWEELMTFVDKYKVDQNFGSVHDGDEYWLTYHNTCISFYQRLLQCDDLTPELRDEYQRMIDEHHEDINRIVTERTDRENRDGTTSRNNLIEQGLTDEIIDKYFALVQNADTGNGVYLPKGMGIRYTIEQKGNSVSLRFFNPKGEQTRFVYIQDGMVISDIDTTNTQKTENNTQKETIDGDKKRTGGTYQSLISMGFTPALIQRYFDAPSTNAAPGTLERNVYTLKKDIEVIPGSGAYITDIDELVEILKKYGVIK